MIASRYIITVSGVALSVVCSAPAYSQSGGSSRLDITAGVSVRHDSNVARSSEEFAETRGVSAADQVIAPSITLDAVEFFGRHNARVTGSVGYDFYRRNTQLNRERLSLNAVTTLAAQECELELSAGFNRQQSDLGFNNFFFNAPDSVVKNTESLVTIGSNLACGSSFGLRPTFGITRTEGNNSNIFRQRSDFGTTTLTTGVGYRHPTIGNFQLTASRGETKFPNKQLQFVQNDFVTRSVTASFDRDIGARWNADVRVGYTTVDSAGIAGSNFEGLTYGLGLNGQISPQFRLSADVSRAARTALNNNAAYSVDTSYGLTGFYDVNPLISITAGYQYSEQDYFYSNDTVNAFGTLLENERRHAISGSISYARTRRLVLSLDAGYNKRTTNLPFFDYDGYSAGLSIRSTF